MTQLGTIRTRNNSAGLLPWKKLSDAALNIIGTSNGARIRLVQLNCIVVPPMGILRQIGLIARTFDSLPRHGHVTAACSVTQPASRAPVHRAAPASPA